MLSKKINCKRCYRNENQNFFIQRVICQCPKKALRGEKKHSVYYEISDYDVIGRLDGIVLTNAS